MTRGAHAARTLRGGVGRAAPLLLLLLIAAIYCSRLGSAPVYLASDEAIIANDVRALAATGRTLDGAFLPLFFYIPLSASWFMPVIYYWSAPFVVALPFAEWSIRLPTAAIGLISVGLIYNVALRIFGERRLALVAAAVLACAPAFFTLSRYALDYVYPVPFILGWLLCLAIALDPRRSRGWFVISGLCLGLGLYSYIASLPLMPMYLTMTLVALIAHRRSASDTAALLAGFAVPLIVFLIWFAQHPEAFQGTADRYGLRSLDVGAIAGRYLRFFSPDFLFMTGDTYLPFSTRTAGVFALASVVLIVTGIYAVIAERHLVGLVVLGGFVVSPLAAAVLDDAGAIRRAIGMVPFGALLAAFGARQLAAVARVPGLRTTGWLAGGAAAAAGLAYLVWIGVSQARVTPRGLQAAGLGLTLLTMAAFANRVKHGTLLLNTVVAAIVVQFALFQYEYHGPYRVRASPWLNGNIRGAMLRLIEEADRDRAAPIVFATLRSGLGHWDLRNRWLPSYWRFYIAREGREDLLARTIFHTYEHQARPIAPGSLVMASGEDPQLKQMLAAGASRIADVPELDRAPSFVLVRR